MIAPQDLVDRMYPDNVPVYGPSMLETGKFPRSLRFAQEPDKRPPTDWRLILAAQYHLSDGLCDPIIGDPRAAREALDYFD